MIGRDEIGDAIGWPLVEASFCAVLAVDVSHRIRYCDPAAERVFGYAARELVGRWLDALIPGPSVERHRKHLESFFEEAPGFRRMASRRPVEGLRRSGELFPARIAIMQVDVADEPFAVAVVEDLTEAALRDRLVQQLKEVLEHTPDFVGLADREGTVTWHNRAARELLGDRADERGYHVCDSHPEWAANRILEEGFPAALANGSWRGVSAIFDAVGREVPVDQVLVAHPDTEGCVDLVSTIARDLRPMRSLQAENLRQSRALEQAGDMIWITDAAGLIEYVNPAFERSTGYGHADAVGRSTGSLIGSGQHTRAFYERLWTSLRDGRVFRAVFRNRTRSGELIHVDETIAPVVNDEGRIDAFVVTGRDVTERMQVEQQLRELATLDPLTRLPNRADLAERLEKAVAHAERTGRMLAVLFLDLDNFKDINDADGHAVGDEVLRTLAGRLSGALRRNDTVGRQGGDELMIVLEDVETITGVEAVADKLLEILRRPLSVNGTTFEVRGSLGIACYPGGGSTADGLVTSADAAMYRAKQAGGDGYAFHTPELNASREERRFVLRALRNADDRGELSVFLQPIIEAVTGRLTGVEILLRWYSGEHGWIEPDRFIPIAEETGQIREIGATALRRACSLAATWQATGLRVPPISVNVSSVQLAAPDFPDQVLEVLAETGLSRAALVIEITETTFMADDPRIASALERLRAHDVGIAIDDFGVGYSSLAYLKRFPADRIKLDREFVGVEADAAGNVPIIESVVALGRAFRGTVVAEGVEREEEAKQLRELGVGELQGFLFGHPMDPAEFERIWLRAEG